MRRWSRLAVIVVALLVVSGAAPAASAASPMTAGSTAEATAVASSASLGDSPDGPRQVNNSTHHENPDEADEEGDLESVTRWLEGRLGDRLDRSAVSLSQREYELARAALGDGYDGHLGRYADVAGDTDTDVDDANAETFAETRRTQSEFVDAVQTYRETADQYREAKEAGDEARSRELARELAEEAARVNGAASDLRADYGTLSEQSAADLDDASETVSAIDRNVTEQQAAIRAEEFVEAQLTVETDDREVSFLDPLRVRGRLTANGTSMVNETVQFDVGGRTISTTTDADGEFAFTYRPTTLPLGEQTVRITYLPEATSPYLGANASVTVTVSQVTPTVSVTRAPGVVRFDETLTVTGSVAADNTTVADVPVAVTLGETRLGETRTDAEGAFALRARVPADVPNGTRAVRAEVALDDRALGPGAGTVPVDVARTPTALTVVGDQTGTDLRMRGTLATVDGTPLGGQPVRLSVEGRSVGTVRTTQNGSFDRTVRPPAGVVPDDGNASVNVTAAFDPERSNLEAARAETTVELAPANRSAAPAGQGFVGGGRLADTVMPWLPIAGGIALLLGIGVVALWRRSTADETRTADLTSPAATAAADSDGSEADALDSASPLSPDEPSPLAPARTHLESDAPDTAVQSAYAVGRRHLRRAVDVSERATHWEFYDACETADVDNGDLGRLEQLTEVYERAAFAPGTVPAEQAETAVGLVDDLLDTRAAD